MKLFVANCTHQVQDFVYHLPETPAPRKQIIAIGGQIQVTGDLSKPEIDAIVGQHARYGLVRVDEIDRTKPFIGVCYSVDKPVSIEGIKRALAHNQEVLVDLGRQIRTESAVALNNAIEENAGGLQNLEMSVVEENQDRHEGPTPVVAEGVRVNRTADGDKPARRARH